MRDEGPSSLSSQEVKSKSDSTSTDDMATISTEEKRSRWVLHTSTGSSGSKRIQAREIRIPNGVERSQLLPGQKISRSRGEKGSGEWEGQVRGEKGRRNGDSRFANVRGAGSKAVTGDGEFGQGFRSDTRQIRSSHGAVSRELCEEREGHVIGDELPAFAGGEIYIQTPESRETVASGSREPGFEGTAGKQRTVGRRIETFDVEGGPQLAGRNRYVPPLATDPRKKPWRTSSRRTHTAVTWKTLDKNAGRDFCQKRKNRIKTALSWASTAFRCSMRIDILIALRD
ncbi:hypothetical protein DFH08DRAFT_804002 [Mycena albidolilacea]|uniref:Uncharacterized protein n=1 Tax=Mycena albidolilacea TaxID=1033008 RepID=A0AAD7AB90_9AGAR|nr:hypothetical protein DFH08DRAFT_804002 [Mycena albidolilacea]